MNSHIFKTFGPVAHRTPWGVFQIYVFRDKTETEHLAIVSGTPEDNAIARLHSECLTGDVLGSLRCDCGQQFQKALQMIDAEQNGIVVYLRGHEGRGIGLANKIRAYEIQDRMGLDTVEANLHLGLPVDSRSYESGIAILRFFKLTSVRLLTDNPLKIDAFDGSGIRVTERIEIKLPDNPISASYLETKRAKMGHIAPDRPNETSPKPTGSDALPPR